MTSEDGNLAQQPVTVEDVCEWADAFDVYHAAEALAVPNEPSFREFMDAAEATWLSRWKAHRSIAAICRLVRDQTQTGGPT